MQQNADLNKAIELLSTILSQYRGTLLEHQNIQTAFQMLIDKATEAKVEINAESIEEVKPN